MNKRVYQYDLMPEIKKRWSARALSSKPVPESEWRALIEAATFAPSCFNEQPWRYLVADTADRREKLFSCLTPGNQAWVEPVPLLMLVTAKKNFARNDSPNRFNQFDTGTSLGLLALEATRRDLIVHPMAGFNPQKAREVFNLPQDLDVICVLAIGYYGDPKDLPEDYRAREFPAPRMPVDEILI